MAEARAVISWIVGRPKVASLVTTTRLKWTVFGRLFPTTRSITWSRPMVVLTSALRDRWVRTRALYSALFCRQRADRFSDEGGSQKPACACPLLGRSGPALSDGGLL